MSVDIAKGQSNLEHILNGISASTNWNEAQTRYHFIDRFLENALGWDRITEIEVEHRLDNCFADYVLGRPFKLVIEAKREGVHFDLPAGSTKKIIQSIRSLTLLSPSLGKAIEQVQSYCARRGVQYAAICNGYQLIAFVAVRIGAPPLEGRALVIDGFDSYKKHFPDIWQLLSPAGIEEHKLRKFLDEEYLNPPRKLSTIIDKPLEYRYKSELHASLRTLGELLLEDIPKSGDVEEQFLDECYVSTRELDEYAILSKKTLHTRYTQFLREHAGQAVESDLESQIDRTGPAPEIKAELSADAASRRPLILLGDVGVGKTTFLRNLVLRSAKAEILTSIFIYLDLGASASLSENLERYILDQIENQIRERYGIDIQEKQFVRGGYDLEIKRFRASVFGGLYESNREKYDEKVTELLHSKVDNRSEHIKNSIRHISLGRRKQVVVIIDNTDQRKFEVQQSAFTIAQDIAENWTAIVFLTLRPQTFYQSKLAGVLSAYPNRILTISPPPITLVLEKRIDFALRVARGQVKSRSMENITINLSRISDFLSALLRSIKTQRELSKFLSNITGGNVRSAVDMITKFCGSPNVDVKKIIDFEERGDGYRIPLHEFTKHALLGEYRYFNPSSSTVALNLFDVHNNDEREHFLAPLILSYCGWSGPHRDKDTFVETSSMIGELQSVGFTPAQVEWHIRRLASRNLIEAVERISLHAEQELEGMPLSKRYRLTSVGSYHVKVWIYTFSYIEAVSIDTPLHDSALFERLSKSVDDFDIAKRFIRARAFKDYLLTKWMAAVVSKPYFDFVSLMNSGNPDFEKVAGKMVRH
jgi:hypothetical protein